MAKKPAAIRVHQLGKELGVDSKIIVAKCVAEEIPNIKDHMSVVSMGLAATIREWFSDHSANQSTAVESAAAVDIVKAKATARKRTSKKAASSADDSSSSSSGDTMVAVQEVEEETITTTTRKPRRAAAEPPAETHETEVSATVGTQTHAKKTPPKPARETASPSDNDATPPAGADTTEVHADSDADAPSHHKAMAKPYKAPPAPPSPPPVMNQPKRPQTIAPAGPMLSAPKKTEMKGPKVIRVEAPDVIAAPRARTGPRTGPSTPGRTGAPRAGRGVGAGPDTGEGARGGAAGRDAAGKSSRRNNRRSASATEDAGRSARSGAGAGGATPEAERPWNWREQDLIEREKRLNRSSGFIKQARRDNLKRQTGGGHRAVMPAESGGKVKVRAPIGIKELSAATGVKMTDIVKKLFMSGKMVTANSVLDASTAMEVMLEYGIELEIDEQKTAEVRIVEQFQSREIIDERRRSPVVTILGHVDHGKTSLLDKIRNANVAAGEAGGITQATSAFQVPVKVGEETHQVTFIDTPGHEAFTEMRSRGAKVTDIVVLVVAADDGVMPQTIESISHAKAAGVPIVVVLNKIDKPEATDGNIQRILGQLAERELNPVEWGGTTEVIRTSATKGTGIQELLETLDYQAQLLDLKAGYGGLAQGSVLEARLQEGRGPVANILVQQGTLKKGDFIVAGRSFGRVRDITNDHGKRIDQATPSMAVAFSGLNELPDAGDNFYVVKSLKAAEEAAAERGVIERNRDLAKEKVTLDNVFKHLEATGKKELSLLVKADVQGSVETLKTVLARIVSEEITVSLKQCSVGGVNESDVALAEATGAIILAFNVTASAAARKLAEARGVDVRFYDVIYDLTDDVKSAAEGMLDPELKIEILGHAEVRGVFKISRVGMIAGCYVTDGVIERNSQIRVTRGGIVVEKDRRLKELKRFKDDAKEVRSGQECGMNIDGYNDIKVGDVLECYKTREVKRKL